MSRIAYVVSAFVAMWVAVTAHAQAPATPDVPKVTVNASASASVPNDRLQAWVRAETELPDATAAANQVNAAIAKGLARAKGVAGVTVATSGYSTQPITEKGRATRWRVTQTISLTGSDFAAIAGLLTRMQEQDGLLLSGMSFSLSPNARDQAERTLIQQAVRSWQLRAQISAAALGFDSWRTGQVNVQSNDGGRVYATMRAQPQAAAEFSPVSVEAGVTEVTITVSGDALLEGPGKR